jgi:hypothetical protein
MTEALPAAKATSIENGARLLALRDILSWVLDEPNKFEEEVMAPCDAVDLTRGKERVN